MSLLELLETDFSLSKEIFLDVQAIDKRVREEFSYRNEYIIDNTSAHYLREIHLQNEIAVSVNKVSLGFDILEKQLANCNLKIWCACGLLKALTGQDVFISWKEEGF